jgi:hypothetical protein
MMTVLYEFCVLCVVVRARGSWFLVGVCRWRTTYRRYHGIVLGVGISIVVLDTYAILVKYLAREYGGREKKYKSVVLCVLCVVCCKKQFSTTTILPTANMRLTYEGIGMYVDDWSFVFVFL